MTTLIRPFVDPLNTFRAHVVTDMFKIVPTPEKYWNELPTTGASFQYDIGIKSGIRSLIFSFQNRTVSHILRVELTLPPYIKSEKGTIFDISIDSIENVIFHFSEEQVQFMLPGVSYDSILFDIYPINVNGPVFVNELSIDPVDLNAEFGNIGDKPVLPPDALPEGVLEVPVFISKEVEVNKWIDGTDGQSKDWPPPPRWTVGEDGAMYPPLPDANVCDTVGTGTGRDGDLSNRVDLTPLEILIKESLMNTAPTYGSSNRRRGFVINPLPILTGDPDQSEQIFRKTISYMVTDSNINNTDFKIINWQKTFTDGTTVPARNNLVSTSSITSYLGWAEIGSGFGKEGEYPKLPGSTMINGMSFPPQIAFWTENYIKEGEKIDVPSILLPREFETRRAATAAASIISDIKVTGQGSLLSELKDKYGV